MTRTVTRECTYCAEPVAVDEDDYDATHWFVLCWPCYDEHRPYPRLRCNA